MKNGNGGDLSASCLSDVEIEPEELDDDSVHVLQQVSSAFSIRVFLEFEIKTNIMGRSMLPDTYVCV